MDDIAEYRELLEKLRKETLIDMLVDIKNEREEWVRKDAKVKVACPAFTCEGGFIKGAFTCSTCGGKGFKTKTVGELVEGK